MDNIINKFNVLAIFVQLLVKRARFAIYTTRVETIVTVRMQKLKAE